MLAGCADRTAPTAGTPSDDGAATADDTTTDRPGSPEQVDIDSRFYTEPCPDLADAGWWIDPDDEVRCYHRSDGDEAVLLEPVSEVGTLGGTVRMRLHNRTDEAVPFGPYHWEVLRYDRSDGAWRSATDRDAIEDYQDHVEPGETHEWDVQLAVDGDAPDDETTAGETVAFRPGRYAFVVAAPDPGDLVHAALFAVEAGDDPPVPDGALPDPESSAFRGEACPAGLRCYHALDGDERVYLRAEPETVALGETLSAELCNWSGEEVTLGPDHWAVKRREGGEWVSADRREIRTDLGGVLRYGDCWDLGGRVTVDAADEPGPGAGIEEAVAFEPGEYRFEIDARGEDWERRFAARFTVVEE
ncbi:hypothetical protein GCM10027435_06540 [Haloparvum alkalitolerans]